VEKKEEVEKKEKEETSSPREKKGEGLHFKNRASTKSGERRTIWKAPTAPLRRMFPMF